MAEKFAKIFGPYYRASDEDKWHWIESCPDFPKGENPHSMVGSHKPSPEKLCPTCNELDTPEVPE